MALQMTWQHRNRRIGLPLGLKNLGNTCYLNSVLQCLTFTPPLAQFCLSSQHSSLCKSVFSNRERDCPFCILERQIVRSLSLDATLDAPSKIQKCLNLFAEHFRWGRQEDAHEFLRYVIDACHNTCLKLRKNLPTSNGASNGTTKEHGSITVMKEIFGGALLSQVKCLSCKGESNKTDEIMDISLDLFQSNSVKDALGRFFQPEVLDGNNKYSCGKCKKLSVARKQMFILRAPNVLVIQLKRFEGIHVGKINRNIDFEEVLVLSKFMCSESQDSQPEYNLFGSIVHSGYTPESGHYYAYVKDATGRWYCCNDAHVSLSSTQEVLSEKVYILFYLRSSQNPRSSKASLVCNGAKFPNGSDVSLCQKSAIQLKPPILKLNGAVCSTNNVSTMLKNGKISPNPAILLKPPILKLNGAVCSTNNVSTMLKNGKISPNPEIKPNSLESLEIKKVVANGNGSVEKCSDFEQSLAVKKNNISPECKSMEESKVAHKVEVSSMPNISVVDGKVSSDMVEHNRKKTLPVPNGNGLVNISKVEGHEHNGTQNVAAVERQPDCNHASNNTNSKCSSCISGFKRKSCDSERADVPVLSTKNSCSFPGEDVSCKTQSTYRGKHSLEELMKYKDLLFEDTDSYLRSCGWVDEVQNFMRTRKRLCKRGVGSYPDNPDLRKQLIADAKKTFLSQIPESLKEQLIECLRSFSHGKPLLDA